MNGMQYTRSHMLFAIRAFRGTEMSSEHHESMKHFKAEYVSFLRFFSIFPLSQMLCSYHARIKHKKQWFAGPTSPAIRRRSRCLFSHLSHPFFSSGPLGNWRGRADALFFWCTNRDDEYRADLGKARKGRALDLLAPRGRCCKRCDHSAWFSAISEQLTWPAS